MVLGGKMNAKSIYLHENNTSNIHENFSFEYTEYFLGISVYIMHIHTFMWVPILCC